MTTYLLKSRGQLELEKNIYTVWKYLQGLGSSKKSNKMIVCASEAEIWLMSSVRLFLVHPIEGMKRIIHCTLY